MIFGDVGKDILVGVCSSENEIAPLKNVNSNNVTPIRFSQLCITAIIRKTMVLLYTYCRIMDKNVIILCSCLQVYVFIYTMYNQ